eukprot:179279-Chlamydomonas_euryale.AAC.1
MGLGAAYVKGWGQRMYRVKGSRAGECSGLHVESGRLKRTACGGRRAQRTACGERESAADCMCMHRNSV